MAGRRHCQGLLGPRFVKTGPEGWCCGPVRPYRMLGVRRTTRRFIPVSIGPVLVRAVVSGCSCRPSAYTNNVLEQDHRHQETNRRKLVVSIGRGCPEYNRRIRGHEHDPQRADPVVSERRRGWTDQLHSPALRYRFSRTLPCLQHPNNVYHKSEDKAAMKGREPTTRTERHNERPLLLSKADRIGLEKFGQPCHPELRYCQDHDKKRYPECCARDDKRLIHPRLGDRTSKPLLTGDANHCLGVPIKKYRAVSFLWLTSHS